MSKLRTITLSLSLVAGSAVFAEERPAVRMLPAKPMDPVDALTVRAAPGGFDPFQKPAGNDNARIRNLFDKVNAADKPAAEPGNWTKFTKWMDERAKAVKKAVNGPPEQQPPPRVGGAAPPPAQPPQQPLRKFFEPKKDPTPEVAKVNAANPAYRWYGWGTATPGANEYAPAGDYPHGSAAWYNQTGATPGAFPVPTMNPYRAVPGSEPPTYTPPPMVAQALPPVFVPPPSIPVTSRKTIAQTPSVPNLNPPQPAPVPASTMPVPAMPADWQSKPKNVDPNWRPASMTEPAKPEAKWKPAETMIVPVIRGQDTGLDGSPMAKSIHAACKGVVTNVTIRETGPGQLTISFSATTTTLAEIAVRAMANIAELKPFTVDFAGKVNQ